MEKRLERQKKKMERKARTQATIQSVLHKPAPQNVPDIPEIPTSGKQKRQVPKAHTGVEQKKPKHRDQQKKEELLAVANADVGMAEKEAEMRKLVEEHNGYDEVLGEVMTAERRDIEQLEKRKDDIEVYGVEAPEEHAALLQEVQLAEKKHLYKKRGILSARADIEGRMRELQDAIKFITFELENTRQEDAETSEWYHAQAVEVLAEEEQLRRQLEALPISDVVTDEHAGGEVFEELRRGEAMEVVPPPPPMTTPPHTPERAGRKVPTAAIVLQSQQRGKAQIEQEGPREAQRAVQVLEMAVTPPRSGRTATKMGRGLALEIHGSGGAAVEDLYRGRKTGTVTQTQRAGAYTSPSTASTVSEKFEDRPYRSVHSGSGSAAETERLSGLPWGSDTGTYRSVHSGKKYISADVPETLASDWALSSQRPEPVRRRRIGLRQGHHTRDLRRKIHPVLRHPNFSLRKLSPGKYVLTAKEVSLGVVEQIRGLLVRVPGTRVIVDGRIFGKASGFREIVRVLTERGTVQVSLS